MKVGNIIFAVSTIFVLPIGAHPKAGSASEALARLQQRDNTCPSSNPTACNVIDPKLPSNFCCGSGSSCLSSDNSSTAVCCPGLDPSQCQSIQTISCDIAAQDPSQNGAVITTRTNDKLPTCGAQCCPFGYTCSQASNGKFGCSVDKSKAIIKPAPGNSSTTSTTVSTSVSGSATIIRTTSTITTTATITPTGSAASPGLNSNNPPPTKESSFSAGAFFAGFLPGIAIGIIVALGCVVWIRRRKQEESSPLQKGRSFKGPMSMAGDGARPFISLPMKNDRYSNQGRSDFLTRTRSRARSMFSSKQSPNHAGEQFDQGFHSHKMPTPPADANIPIHYLNDMPFVENSPTKRVAYWQPEDDTKTMKAVSDTGHDLNPSEEIVRIYSPEAMRTDSRTTQMPNMPLASVPPLRGMQTQRRQPSLDQKPNFVSRSDSGKAFTTAKDLSTFGSPFQTPERRPAVFRNDTPSFIATYHDAATVGDGQGELLTPARYGGTTTADSTGKSAGSASIFPTPPQRTQGLPSQASSQPIVPPRPQKRENLNTSMNRPRPETQVTEFDFDEGISEHDYQPSPVLPLAQPPRPANPTPTSHPVYPSRQYYDPQSATNKVNPSATFDAFLPVPNPSFSTAEYDNAIAEKNKKSKHDTNATTFTTMLRNVGFPDPLKMPEVPRLPNSNAATPLKKMKSESKKGRNVV